MNESNNIDAIQLRREYGRGELLESDVLPDPVAQFARWFDDAVKADVAQPNAASLATADAAGVPSARIILLKTFDSRGFVFCTNYTSRKGRDLDVNPRAAMVFFWEPLERQIRIEGAVEKTDPRENEQHFHARPRSAQISAWASHQSEKIESRNELKEREAQIAAKFATGPIPLPDFWGGYRLIPSAMEFWQGRPGRLHDRIIYQRQPGNAWQIRRLQP